MRRWRTDGFTRRGFFAAALAGFVAAGWQHWAHAESSAPIVGSFSRAGLDRVGNYVRNEIATGKIPGAILLIQQHGKPVYFENFGVRDVATKIPMSPDTIFRLYSMSKPITSVAAMMLVEDGMQTPSQRGRIQNELKALIYQAMGR
jgi:CubicO group peptidase (beta-lactamase class C family)